MCYNNMDIAYSPLGCGSNIIRYVPILDVSITDEKQYNNNNILCVDDTLSSDSKHNTAYR